MGYLRIIHKDRIDDWLHDYLKWYRNTMKKQEIEGSGYVYNRWIDFHIEMLSLRTFVGYKHPTPSILGQSVVNPNIDYNRCLQRCLILANEGGYKIITNRKMGDASVYSKWWKQPDKYKMFGVTIHEIEEAMDICDNKFFEQSEEKYSRLEELLNVPNSVFKVTLLPGYDDKKKGSSEMFSCTQVYHGRSKIVSTLSLYVVNDENLLKSTLKNFMYIKDLSNFKERITRQSDANNRHLSRNKNCSFFDFFGSQTAIRAHEVQAHCYHMDDRDQYELSSEETNLQFTNQRFEMPAPVVVYADFESAIDEKNKHKPIMLSYLAVSRITTIHTQLQVFHAPHENESGLHPFMDYLIQLQGSVKRHLFNELPLEYTLEIENNYRCAIDFPFCRKSFARGVRKVRHHAHVVGEYSNGVEVKYYEAGSTSIPVARSAIYNSHLTRRTIDYQYTSTMDFIMNSHSS